MRILQNVQKYNETWGLCRPQLFETCNNQNYFNWKNSIVLAVLGMGTISSSAYVYYEDKTIINVSNGLYIVLSAVVYFFIFLVVIVGNGSQYELIDYFEKIVHRRLQNPAPKKSYEETIAKIEKITTILHHFLVKGTPLYSALPYAVGTTISYFTKCLTPEDYVLPAELWIPFNWKTFPLGYFSGLLIQTIFFIAPPLVVFSYISLLLASYLLFKLFIEDMKHELTHLNKIWKQNQNRMEFAEKFYEIIQFHVDTKQCCNILSENYQLIFLLQFLWSLLTIIGNLLMIQMEMGKGHLDLTLISTLAVKIFYSFGLLFVYCEIGERINSFFGEINDDFYEMEWEIFPLSIQRMMPTVLINTQQPVQLEAFGNIPCTRLTFKDIVDLSYSFFTVLNGMQ